MIKGKSISLHRLDDEHLEDVYHILMNDKIGCCYATDYQELRPNQLIRFLHTTEPGTGSKAFVIKHKDIVVGFITLNNIHSMRRSAYIGIVGIAPKNQNKLHGVDALRILINYSFNVLNLHRIYGHTLSDNSKMSLFYKRGSRRLDGIEKEFIY